MPSAILEDTEYQELWIKALGADGSLRSVGCVLGFFTPDGSFLHQEISTLFIDSDASLSEIMLYLAVDPGSSHARAVMGALKNTVLIGEASSFKVYLFAPTPHALEVARRQDIQDWAEGLSKLREMFDEEQRNVVN